MKILQDILYRVSIQAVNGSLDIKVKDIHINSKLVSKGSLFIAIRGERTDGHNYIDDAILSGASSVICEKMPLHIAENITYVKVKNTHEAVAHAAHNFYDEPSNKLKLTGVTGTNGKTTVATILFNLFTQLGYKCGLISTVQNQIINEIIPATHTTPDAISLNILLKRMTDAGCSHVFMECSSHAIHQHRISGLNFAGGIFTNITHDHLDYHKTFDEYIRAKKSFFDQLSSNSFVLSNLDDKRGTIMLQNTLAKKYYYSLKTSADFKGKILENSLTGLLMLINEKEVHFRLIGEFNAYNLLAIYGAAICLKENSDEVLRTLSGLNGAEGRFDYFISKKNIMAIIDYAHTPDALQNVLLTIKKLRRGSENIITVVGCGGERDKTKRPVMAQIVCELSDKAIFTSDNPRSEDPSAIFKDMELGLNSAAKRKSIFITDRKEAIKKAVSEAKKDDIILLAGKGHEKYQVINGKEYDFNDKQILKETFEALKK